MPRRISIAGRLSRLEAWLASILFAAVGMAIIAAGINGESEYRASDHWPTTQATLDRIDLRGSGSSDHRSYNILLSYHFHYAGRHYTGSRIQPSGNAYGYPSANFDSDYAFLREHLTAQQSLPCFVDPANPNHSFLFRRPVGSAALILVGVFVLLIAPSFVILARPAPTDSL